METVRNDKLRRNSFESNPSPSPTIGIPDQRNWNDLPEPILSSILALLPSMADVASAASVSHPWNAAAAAASNNEWAPQRPPLILTPILPENLLKINRVPRLRPLGCYLMPLDSPHTSKPYYHPVLSSYTLQSPHCLGRHFSKLILVNDAFIILHDVFSGEQIRSPKIASLRDQPIQFATLTAPLHSSSLSLVLLVTLACPYCYVFSWEPNGNGNRDGKFKVDTEIMSFALFKDQVYYVDDMRMVGVLDFEPTMSCRLLGDMFLEKLPVVDMVKGGECYLVECDGELLIVLFILNPDTRLSYKMKINVYKIDLEKREWVKKEKLNNWCLFIDTNGKGRTGFSCKDPERWGGRSNCVYVPVSNCVSYSICSLNDEFDILEETWWSLTSKRYKRHFSLWDYPDVTSSLWVYPSIKRVEKVGIEKAQSKFKKVKTRGQW